jgi:hypothetical protein
MFQQWSRIRYDADQEVAEMQDRRWNELRSIPVNCAECFQPAPESLAQQGVSTVKGQSLVEVESQLRNMGIPLTSNPSTHAGNRFPLVTPCEGSNGDTSQTCGRPDARGPAWQLENRPECPIETTYSRLDLPTCRYRELGVDRFEPLCRNPQDLRFLEHPGEILIHQRMVVKDNHRPCLATPMDQSHILPPSTEMFLRGPCDSRIPPTFTGPLRPQRFTQTFEQALGRA